MKKKASTYKGVKSAPKKRPLKDSPKKESVFSKNAAEIISRFSENTTLQLAIIVLLPLIVFLKVVNFEFILDDIMIIRNNIDVISNLNNIKEAFTRDAFFVKPGTSFYRPIQTVGLMFDAAISGINPWMYHFTNLLLHILTGVALYYLLRFFNFKRLTAFFGTALFAIHPLVACAVSWIPSRGDLYIGLFGILLFLTMGYYYRTKKPVFFILHVIIYALTIFSKETVVLFPALLIVFYIFFLKEEKHKELYKFVASWVSVSAIFFIIKSIFVTEKLTSSEFGIPALIKNLTFFPVVLSKVFLPFNLPIYPFYDAFSIISGLLIMIVLGYYSVNLYRKKQWLPLLGIVWFVIFISPPMLYRQKDFEYVIINLEQRVYLPLIGLILPLTYEIAKFIEKGKAVAVLSASVVLLLVYAGLATVHADDYRDAINYSNAAIQKNPSNAGAYTYLGFNCFERQDVPGAFDNFTKAIEIAQYPMAYFNRGAIKAAAGDNRGAEEDFNMALARDTTLDLAFFKRGSVRFLMNRFDEALSDLRRAEKLNPKDPLILNMKGKVYNGQQKYHDAIEEFTKAITLAPAFIEPYEGRSLARFNVRDFEGTVNDCQKILNLRPNDINTYKNMGQAYREMKRYDKSLVAYTNAIKLDSAFAPAYFGRGLTKRMMNDIEGWKADWFKAGQYGFTPPQPSK